MKIKLTQLALGSMLMCMFAACFGGQHIGPDRIYIRTAVVPPCSDENYDAMIRCGRTDHLSPELGGMAGLGVSGGPASLYKLITSADAPEFATHVVIRGSVRQDSVRCSKWELAKLPHWPDDMPFREDFRHLMCFGDVEVYEYVLGVGPGTLTVAIGGRAFYESAYDSENDFETDAEKLRTLYAGDWVGSERMIFIGPSFNASIEGWIAYGYWDVQLREDGDVVVVAPWKKHYADASETEFQIGDFTAEVQAAHEQRLEAFDGRAGEEEYLHNVLRDIFQIDSVYRHYNQYEDAIATPAPPPPAAGQDHPFPDPQLIGWVYGNRGAK